MRGRKAARRKWARPAPRCLCRQRSGGSYFVDLSGVRKSAPHLRAGCCSRRWGSAQRTAVLRGSSVLWGIKAVRPSYQWGNRGSAWRGWGVTARRPVSGPGGPVPEFDGGAYEQTPIWYQPGGAQASSMSFDRPCAFSPQSISGSIWTKLHNRVNIDLAESTNLLRLNKPAELASSELRPGWTVSLGSS